jgi:hypothetical protein
MFLDIIHRLVFMQKHRHVYFSKHNVSETGFCLRLQVKHTTQLDLIDRASPYLRSGLRNVVFCKTNRTVFLDKDRTMDNVQKHNIYTKIKQDKNSGMSTLFLKRPLQIAFMHHVWRKSVICGATIEDIKQYLL